MCGGNSRRGPGSPSKELAVGAGPSAGDPEWDGPLHVALVLLAVMHGCGAGPSEGEHRGM